MILNLVIRTRQGNIGLRVDSTDLAAASRKAHDFDPNYTEQEIQAIVFRIIKEAVFEETKIPIEEQEIIPNPQSVDQNTCIHNIDLYHNPNHVSPAAPSAAGQNEIIETYRAPLSETAEMIKMLFVNSHLLNTLNERNPDAEKIIITLNTLTRFFGYHLVVYSKEDLVHQRNVLSALVTFCKRATTQFPLVTAVVITQLGKYHYDLGEMKRTLHRYYPDKKTRIISVSDPDPDSQKDSFWGTTTIIEKEDASLNAVEIWLSALSRNIIIDKEKSFVLTEDFSICTQAKNGKYQTISREKTFTGALNFIKSTAIKTENKKLALYLGTLELFYSRSSLKTEITIALDANECAAVGTEPINGFKELIESFDDLPVQFMFMSDARENTLEKIFGFLFLQRNFLSPIRIEKKIISWEDDVEKKISLSKTEIGDRLSNLLDSYVEKYHIVRDNIHLFSANKENLEIAKNIGCKTTSIEKTSDGKSTTLPEKLIALRHSLFPWTAPQEQRAPLPTVPAMTVLL